MKTDSSWPRGSRAARGSAVVALALSLSATFLGCNEERKAECEQFMNAMKPLAQGVPTVDEVDRVQSAVAAIKLVDQPLSVYAKNYLATLTVLSNTLKLKAGGAPPDGTDDVIKTNLKQARTDADDTARYCAQ